MVSKQEKRDIKNNKIMRRDNKRKRETERKKNGTYILKKNNKINGLNISKWGKPFYIKEKVITSWEFYERKSVKTGFWLNPITHDLLNNDILVEKPLDNISYKWVSTSPYVDIKPVCDIRKIELD